MYASTNTGMEKPITEKPMSMRSNQPPNRQAASTPSGTAVNTAKMMVRVASETVASSRCPMSEVTFILK